MSVILFISANTAVDPCPVYPLGMAVVAGALEKRGHRVVQHDLLVSGCLSMLADRVRETTPEAVCISLRNIDTTDSTTGDLWYLEKAKRVVDEVRAGTTAPVIVGGSAFSILPERILEYLGADYGVTGEGEQAVPELVEALARGESPPRLTNGGGSLAGEEIGGPSLVRELVDFYVERSTMISLQTKRGCPYSCSYCSYPLLEGTKLRCRPVEKVVDELARIKRDFNVSKVFFTDSVFNDPTGHYLELAQALIEAEVGIKWCGYFRPQGLGRDEVALLKQAGLYAAELGTDGGSQTTLDALSKGFDFDDVVAVNEAFVAEGIPAAHFIIFGGPGESEKTIAEGLDNVARLKGSVVFGFPGVRVLPGAPLRDRAVAEGVIDGADPLLKPTYYFSPEIGLERMNSLLATGSTTSRAFIYPPDEGREMMEVMHRFGYKGLIWDKLLVPAGEIA